MVAEEEFIKLKKDLIIFGVSSPYMKKEMHKLKETLNNKVWNDGEEGCHNMYYERRC